MSNKCEFCDIEDFRRQIVYKTNNFYVLLPRKPKTDGHLMIVPVKHIKRIDELDAKTASEYVKIIRWIYIQTVKDEGENFLGYNTLSNNGGLAVGQHVPHFHLHIFLRYKSERHSPYEILSGKVKSHSYSHEEYNELFERLSKRLSE